MNTLSYETVVLHVGTNSLSSSTFLTDYEDLISVIRQRSCFQDVAIIISSILPRPCDYDTRITIGGETMTVKERVVSLNQQLKRMAKGMVNCQFANSYKLFLVDPSTVRSELFKSDDLLHLNKEGVSELKKYFDGFLRNRHGVMFNPVQV